MSLGTAKHVLKRLLRHLVRALNTLEPCEEMGTIKELAFSTEIITPTKGD